MPAYMPRAGPAGREAGHRVQPERGARAAVAPGHDRPARCGHRRARGHHRRPLHHRSADRGRVGGVGAAPGAGRARRTLAILGIGRAGAQPPRGAGRGAHAPRGPRVVARRAPAASGSWPRWPGTSPAQLSRATESAEDAVRGADIIVLATSSPTPVLRSAWVSRWRARGVGRRLPARSAGDGSGAGRPRAAVRGLARGRAGGVRRRGAGHPRGPVHGIAHRRRSSARWCWAARPAAPARARSRSSSRSAWPSRTWWPRTWSSAARSSRGAARNSASDRLVPSSSGGTRRNT